MVVEIVSVETREVSLLLCTSICRLVRFSTPRPSTTRPEHGVLVVHLAGDTITDDAAAASAPTTDEFSIAVMVQMSDAMVRKALCDGRASRDGCTVQYC